jgi:2-methylcitrate dehydratase PrpD
MTQVSSQDSAPSVSTGDDLTRWLVRRAASLNVEALPSDVVRIAGQCLLDWYGVALAGWSDPLIRALVEEAEEEEGGRPRATLLGSGRKAGMTQAAIVNGAASHVLDFDDVHTKSRVHPSAPLYPAILATAEAKESTGQDIVAAFVAGVEVQSRLGIYMGDDHYAGGWHNTATLGSFGATVAAGRLLGLDENKLVRAMGINATMASGLRTSFGTMCKPFQVGRASANGLFAAQLALRGVDSCDDVIGRADGFGATFGKRLSADAATASPDEFEVRRILFKYHASCFGTHAPIEAAREVRRGLEGLQHIAAIEVTVEPQYLTVCNFTEPRTETEAKFSIAHTVALAFCGRSTSAPESFSPQALDDPAIVDMRRRVSVKGSPDIRRANASVQVALKDGTVRVARADANVAERQLDRQQERLESKFRSLTNGLLNAGTQETIVAACRQLDRLTNVSGLMQSGRIHAAQC